MNEMHVTFLWETNLKSRASFLLILEFIHVLRADLISILGTLAPAGEEFFKSYIVGNHQFDRHCFTRSALISMNNAENTDKQFICN